LLNNKKFLCAILVKSPVLNIEKTPPICFRQENLFFKISAGKFGEYMNFLVLWDAPLVLWRG